MKNDNSTLSGLDGQNAEGVRSPVQGEASKRIQSVSARDAQYRAITEALKALGHGEDACKVVFHAERVAAEMAKIEADDVSEAEKGKEERWRSEANLISTYYPALWEYVSASYAGGAS